MAADIEFYFDFASPYGYLGAQGIDAVAAKHGRRVDWRPFMLGAAFQTEGTQPLTSYPAKGKYSEHDFARTARRLDVPFSLPEGFPHATLAAARAYYWLKDQDADKARDYARAVYRAYFGEGRKTYEAEVVADIAAETIGADRGELLAAIQTPEVKEKLKTATFDALARGVFGAPFYFVDGEPFWGSDRLEQIDQWLATGGW